VSRSSAGPWAVGYYSQTADGNTQGLIEHWKGSAWTVTSFQEPSDNTELTATNGHWAVGYYMTGGTSHAFILERRGTTWTQVSSPSPDYSGLYAISGDWAAGEGPNGPLVLRWTGAKWAQSSASGPSSGELLGISGDWAVGTFDGNFGQETLAEHWNGKTWKQAGSPEPGLGWYPTSMDDELLAVSGDWMVGTFNWSATTCDCTNYGNLALHWNGQKWVSATTPTASDYGLTGIAGTYAVGGNILYWNGKAWKAEKATGAMAHMQLDAVSGPWAVGSYKPDNGPAQALILHRNGITWAQS
jgi:hypothetical protein